MLRGGRRHHGLRLAHDRPRDRHGLAIELRHPRFRLLPGLGPRADRGLPAALTDLEDARAQAPGPVPDREAGIDDLVDDDHIGGLARDKGAFSFFTVSREGRAERVALDSLRDCQTL